MPKPHGSNSETSIATKKRILDAAVEELRDSLWDSDPFPGISLLKVAHKAGISRNGLANHWPSKDSFSRALMQRLLASDEFWDADYQETKREIEAAREMTPDKALLYVVQRELEQIGRHEDWPIGQALVVRATHDPELAAVARNGYVSDTAREWESVLRPLLQRLGRAPRPPLTGEDVAAAYVALLEGAAMRQLVGEDRLTRSRGCPEIPINLYSLAALALLLGLTIHTGDDSHYSTVGDYWDLIE